jgi:hypothetical protein
MKKGHKIESAQIITMDMWIACGAFVDSSNIYSQEFLRLLAFRVARRRESGDH